MSDEQMRVTPPKRRRGPGHGPGGGMVATEKPKDFGKTMKKLINYISKYHVILIVVAIFTIGSTVFNIVGPKVLGKATTEIFKGLMSKLQGGAGIDFERIGQIVLIMVGIYGLSMLMGYVQGFLMSSVVQKIAYQLRKEISQKINKLPMNYYDKHSFGDVLSKITNDVDTLTTGLNQSVTQLISSVATLIGVLVMMLSISPMMTLVALLLLPLSAVGIMVIVKNSQKYFIRQQNLLGDVNGQIEENFGGHNVVKLFTREEIVRSEFEKTNDKLYHSAWKSQFISGLAQPIMVFVGNLG